MTAEEFIRVLREDYLDDLIPEYLWSNNALLRYLNEAIYEANARSHLLHDEVIVPIKAGIANYKLNCCVRDIDEIKINGECPLIPTTQAALDSHYGCCWRSSVSKPAKYFRADDVFTLYPTPLEDSVATVKYWKNPEPLDFSSDLPFHGVSLDKLYFWCAYRASLKADQDTLSEQLGMRYLADFEQFFGKSKSALMQRMEKNFPANAKVIPQRIV